MQCPPFLIDCITPLFQAKYAQRLRAIRATLHRSDFFLTHEVIGSSLLFVHDRKQASIWLIDFAKTVQLPEKTEITHSNNWSVGNHEDGYLIGINNLIGIFEELLNEPQRESLTPSSSDEKLSSQLLPTISRSHSIDEATAPQVSSVPAAGTSATSTTTTTDQAASRGSVSAANQSSDAVSSTRSE